MILLPPYLKLTFNVVKLIIAIMCSKQTVLVH